jgi:hypothetical protein
MHSLLAKIPLVRRPFHQRDVAREERDRAIAERNAAVRLCDAYKAALAHRDRESHTAITPRPECAGGDLKPQLSPRRRCVFCEKEVDAWLPHYFQISDLSDFVRRLEVIGSHLERFSCPHCKSNDRERHLRLFLDRLNIIEEVRSGSLLHMAPEPNLQRYMEGYGFSRYIVGDLFPAEGMQQIDMQKIPFQDETFHILICNHMLEHVDDVSAALREMRRVLKRGGRAICQTPFSPRLATTFEDPLLQSSDDRFFFYAQEDHLRLFGSDIERIFREAGFVGRLVAHSEILPDIDPEQFGVNEREPFFDFVRDPS